MLVQLNKLFQGEKSQSFVHILNIYNRSPNYVLLKLY